VPLNIVCFSYFWSNLNSFDKVIDNGQMHSRIVRRGDLLTWKKRQMHTTIVHTRSGYLLTWKKIALANLQMCHDQGVFHLIEFCWGLGDGERENVFWHTCIVQD
jgi:hypothetical protein